MPFSFFGRKNSGDFPKQFTDISFASLPAKEHAVTQYAKENPGSVFIGWFSQTLAEFRGLFAANGMDENRVTDAKHFSALRTGAGEIIFLEHYPLHEKEIALVRESTQQKFTVYNSLTEPFFTHFGSEKIIELMNRMGFGENEPLQHPMISTAVKNAQQKLAKKITIEQSAVSQQEWMRKNA